MTKSKQGWHKFSFRPNCGLSVMMTDLYTRALIWSLGNCLTLEKFFFIAAARQLTHNKGSSPQRCFSEAVFCLPRRWDGFHPCSFSCKAIQLQKGVSQVSSLHIKKSLAFLGFYIYFIVSTNTEEKHENENLMCKIKEILALRPH